MKLTYLKYSYPKRLIFAGDAPSKGPGEKAPEATGGLKESSEAFSPAEVVSQTPSEIYNDTVSAGGAVSTKYTQGTTILANLISMGDNSGSAQDDNQTGATGTTTSTDPTTNTSTDPTTNTNPLPLNESQEN